jgi:hypothetical protein
LLDLASIIFQTYYLPPRRLLMALSACCTYFVQQLQRLSSDKMWDYALHQLYHERHIVVVTTITTTTVMMTTDELSGCSVHVFCIRTEYKVPGPMMSRREAALRALIWIYIAYVAWGD